MQGSCGAREQCLKAAGHQVVAGGGDCASASHFAPVAIGLISGGFSPPVLLANLITRKRPGVPRTLTADLSRPRFRCYIQASLGAHSML